jgi:phosphonate transport system substrate-binding protein
MKLRALPALAGVALLALGLAACSGGAEATSTPDSGTSASGSGYQPLMDYIAEITGKTVEYHESTDYAALIEAAVAGKVDVASFSGFTYVTATNNGAKLTPISSIVTEEGQEPGYFSQAIVPADSDIDSIEDFEGKKVCFVDPSSTSGYLFPSYNLLEAGIDPTADITPVFAGKHDVSVQKVGEGVECEVGFAEDSEVEKSDAVKVVAETMVPGAPLVYSSALPDDIAQELIDGLAEITIDDIIAAGIDGADTEEFRSVFFATKPVDDAYYDLIRDICKETEAEQCKA